MAYSVDLLSLNVPPLSYPRFYYTGERCLVEFAEMSAFADHVVISGGPEETEELLAIVLDDGEAIPLFESVEEAETFLASTGDFGKDWRAKQVSPRELVELLEYQDDEVEYVALSPPPEQLTGGMEVNVIYREVLIDLLRRQMDAEPPEQDRSFWRRLFGS
jgi:hypothetical protein